MQGARRDNGLPGYGIVETMIAVALFVVIGLTLYQAFIGLISALSATRAQLTAVELMHEQIEIVRNLPYTSVGISGSVESPGVLPASQTLTRGGFTYTVTMSVQNLDDAFDGVIGDTDTGAVADYRRVNVTVACASCKSPVAQTFSTLQAPATTESSASSNGALFIRVLDATGAAVSGAAVSVLNTVPTPDISASGTTDANGWYKLVDVPPGTNAYQVSVSKSGYNSAQTYAPGGSGLSSPSTPHATVSTGQVTQLTFAIDQTATITLSTKNFSTCAAVGSVPFRIYSSKTLGTNGGSTVYKYDQTVTTDGSGNLTLSNMEWDTYTIQSTSTTNGVLGVEPQSSFSVLPGASQNVQLYAGAASARTLLVAVKDSATGLPVTGAIVDLSKSSFTTQTKVTGEGFLKQTDWSGGSGQAAYSSNATKYFAQDGDVDVTTSVGELRLRKTQTSPIRYTTSPADLTSSTFDVGTTANNYSEVFWLPTDQPSQTGTNSVKMQIASNNDNATWNFKGPDNTASTYYTVTNRSINSANDGNRYLRYKVLMSTSSSTYTPNVSDIFITTSQACSPSGQVSFTGLTSGTYTVTVTDPDYATYTNSNVTVSNNWTQQSITLSP